MNPQSLSALIAAMITLAIGLSVLMRDRRRRPYFTFAVFCFMLFFWFLARFFATALKNDAFHWISLLVGTAIPWTAERFFTLFLAKDPRHPAPVSRWITLGTGLFGLLLLYGALFYPIHRSQLMGGLMLAFVFGSLYHCIYLIHARKRAASSRPEAMRLTYLLVGGAASVSLAITDFIPRDWLAFPPIGNVLTVIYMYFISQTLFHYRLLDIKELLGKMVTLTVLVLILTAIYSLLLAWVGAGQPGMFFFNTIVASFVILVIFETLRNWMEDGVNRWMFREKYEFSRKLNIFRQELANIIDVRSVVSRILHILEESERVTHASVYLPDPTGAAFQLAGHIGPEPIEQIEISTRSLFFNRLKESGLLTQEALEQELATELEEGKDEEAAATRSHLATLDVLKAGVCIPLSWENQILGVLNLRDDRLREAYAWDELDELRKVALQAAITLRNSKVYEQMKERDRLAVLGQMAAGLAHEIRNPLGAIKGAAQLLRTRTDEQGPLFPSVPEPDDRRSPAPEAGPDSAGAMVSIPEAASEADEYLDIIVEEVNRLDRVVSQFLGYARPDRGERHPLCLNDVVHKTLPLLESQAKGEVAIVTELAPDLPRVRADAEQLKQVFLNLGINALQSMEGSGQLRISTRLREESTRALPGRMVEVAFRDTGRGIPEEALGDIFIPFFTTKASGTGLGLPICQRIVENHHGSIEVHSHPGKGATFSVLLPVEDSLTATIR